MLVSREASGRIVRTKELSIDFDSPRNIVCAFETLLRFNDWKTDLQSFVAIARYRELSHMNNFEEAKEEQRFLFVCVCVYEKLCLYSIRVGHELCEEFTSQRVKHVWKKSSVRHTTEMRMRFFYLSAVSVNNLVDFLNFEDFEIVQTTCRRVVFSKIQMKSRSVSCALMIFLCSTLKLAVAMAFQRYWFICLFHGFTPILRGSFEWCCVQIRLNYENIYVFYFNLLCFIVIQFVCLFVCLLWL